MNKNEKINRWVFLNQRILKFLMFFLPFFILIIVSSFKTISQDYSLFHIAIDAVLTLIAAVAAWIMAGEFQKKAETHKALLKSEERYALAQRAANIGSWDWNILTGALSWSEQIEPMFGFKKGDFGATYEAFLKSVHPDDRSYIERAVNAAVYEDKEYDIEHRIVWPDGCIKWIQETGEVIKNDTGRPVRMLGVVRDITRRKQIEAALMKSHEELEQKVIERTTELAAANMSLMDNIEALKLAEKKLRNSQQTLQGVFDGISDPLILFGKDNNVIKFNLAAKKYYGIIHPDDAIGKPCFEGILGKKSACEECTVVKSLSEAIPQGFERKSIMTPNRIEQVYLYPVFDDDGSRKNTVLRIHDITERKLLEKQLIQSEKLASIGVLVSGIAHEINNPNNFVTFNMPILKDYLNALMPIVDAYAEKHPELEMFYMPYKEFREDIFKLLDNVEHGSKRIRTIIDDLKTFSRAGYERKPEKVNIKPVIDKVVAFTQSKLKRTVKTFLVKVPVNLPKVLIDSQSLEQVLVNFLINAAQAFKNPGDENSRVELNVSIDDSKKSLIINVKDNGCGMDEQTKRKIFDPFFTTKTSEEGTGLGMYISHNLVENMGGRIEVESASGKGSRFTIIMNNVLD